MFKFIIYLILMVFTAGWTAGVGAAAAVSGLDALRADLDAYGAEAAGLDGVAADHRLARALRGKTLKRHRVVVPGADMFSGVVPGADAFFYASDTGTVAVLTAGPRVVGRYLMPVIRGAEFRTLDGAVAEPGAPVPAGLVYAVTDLGWHWVMSRTTLTPTKATPNRAAGANVDESAVRYRLRVDPDAAADSVTTFTTLGAAVARAGTLLQRGEGVKVTVAPGTYREGGIEMWCDGWSEAGRAAVLVIEGEGETPPLVTGAEDWSGGWELVAGSANVYRKPWPHRFGMCEQTWERWGYLIDPRVARSETVTVDGMVLLPSMLEQFAWVDPDGAVPLDETGEAQNQPGRWQPQGVRDPRSLRPGTFGVVEAEGAIYVCPPEEIELNGAAVEVAVRPFLLSLNGRDNVVLRNLAFVHTATFVGGHVWGVSIGGSNVLVEDCRFDEHGGKAFAITGEKRARITFRRCSFNGNGWKGLSTGYRVDDMVIEDCESSYNNWRGHTGSQHGWDSAGVKAFALDGQVGMTVRGHRSFANLTNGFWLDQSFTPRSPITVTDSLFVANRYGSQLYLEKLTGPVEVRRNVIWNNVGTRAVDGTSWNVRLEDNLLYTANPEQAAVYLHRRGTESEYANHSKDWTARGNLIVSGDASSPLLYDDCSAEQFAEFLETLEADGNVYHAVSPGGAFHLPGGGTGGLDAWRQATGQESGSVFADPAFVSAEDFDWSIGNPEVRAQMSDLPGALSAEDRAKLEYALAQSDRFLSITAAAGHESGPAFELARSAIENHWQPVDLASFANRPLVGPDAWIGAGNALPHLEAGRHVFAGVPFDIPDVSGNARVGVALPSNKVSQTGGQPLAPSHDVPIGRATPAVYVLHGAGWIGDETEAAAVYELVYEDGSTHAAAVRPANPGVASPGVGEWYHAFPRFDNKRTRHVGLQGVGASPGATLYVMELRSPSPQRVVSHLRLRPVPGRDTSVIMLGVTVLDP
ncbi:MAG: right-handed parallel beta-helix repeat-containing protein [Planctomycetota bacterium]